MVEKDTGILERYTGPLSRRIQEEYAIGDEFYHGEVKKGLRNSDGTGVLVGVTKVGSVQGYLLQDGKTVNSLKSPYILLPIRALNIFRS